MKNIEILQKYTEAIDEFYDCIDSGKLKAFSKEYDVNIMIFTMRRYWLILLGEKFAAFVDFKDYTYYDIFELYDLPEYFREYTPFKLLSSSAQKVMYYIKEKESKNDERKN